MRAICLFFLFLCLHFKLYSQQSPFFFNCETLGGFTSPDYVPFWLRSNQYGSIPLDNASFSIIGVIRKDYNTAKKQLFDWGAAVEGRANIGNNSNIRLIEGYGKIRIGILELKAGRAKEIMGLCDTVLSSGAFAISGNALGIPKIQISVPEYYRIPIFDNLFAFKGSFAHGWIGEVSHYQYIYSRTIQLNTYLHQKSLYGRFGKPYWKMKLYGGFNHQVFWGNENIYYDKYFTLSQLETFFYVITGKPYGTNRIGTSKIGNQVGSVDIGFEYTFKGFRLLAYRQSIYDIGALYYLANIRDGLNGLSLSNMKQTGNKLHWKKILIEVLYTKNQAGELWSPYTPSGDENYYNNDQFPKGYSYKSVGLGTPFISTRTSIRKELPMDPEDYFVNNRILLIHCGFQGSVQSWDFIIKSSYSLNYGTFGTSEVGHTLGKIRTLPLYGIFSETTQLSSYIEAIKEIKGGLNLNIITAFDAGDLLYNSFGLLIGISKTF